ncbi:YcaO-like family protein [Goodfellowiella coeruleoviolacea]|uniref:Ribosomal protein S12 methylthiotransferase accessory factor n=1 Tax=Goodfellowiella coeruleoviolacea TaxID=334858 RepID=A0AAE3KGW5_9PSEU|nr:YcaO-like family protein [Goodfellowiella coeruleoviolacea]MCP2166655.1 ribosomal protein S12 methylthiotransferase accessory factor [Goodfellowiella coeruleoviolacea]
MSSELLHATVAPMRGTLDAALPTTFGATTLGTGALGTGALGPGALGPGALGAAERAVPLAEAHALGLAAMGHLGLRPLLRDLGRDGELTAWTCTLRGPDGVVAPQARGAGKGHRAEARVGAMFEALEHFLSGPARFDHDQVELCPASWLARGELAAEASAVLLAEGGEQPLACASYAGLLDGRELLAPLYLSQPWYTAPASHQLRARCGDHYDYRQLARYSVNSGSAIGVTEAEAVVHALNETIERDAFSLLLVRAFLTAGQRLTVIDPGSLPAGLAAELDQVRRRVGTEVHLLDITTELGVPTVLAYVPPTAERPHLRGAGTSLSAHHAMHRAISELLQYALGCATLPRQADPFAHLAPLRWHAGLHACGRFDLTAHLARARRVAFVERFAPEHPQGHLDRLVSILTGHGFMPYLRRLATLPGGITAVHVLVPGLERFMVIADGVLVLPGPRALRARTEWRRRTVGRPESVPR